MPSHRSGFTLLEICLALAIGLMVILLAVPSISGLLAEQRMKKSFERFERMVAAARAQSITAQRASVLVWERSGVTLRAAGTTNSDARLNFENGEEFEIRRPAALTKNPPAEWTFWPNETCEPTIVAYHGPAGRWQVRYDALTARAQFLESSVR
jgi:type II secretory pathway pseudopilin PulG